MQVLPEMALRHLMAAMVEGVHMLTDENGTPVVVGTIPASQMRMAVITALQIMTGEPVWPADQEIVVADRPQKAGIFRFAR